MQAKKKFHIILIRPSKYDDNGYIIRWLFGIVSSNSLSCLNALTEDAIEKNAFPEDVEPVIHAFDETYQKIPVRSLSRKIQRAGERALVCFVGVQTNQFARALDLALEFRAEGFECMIGGFHISGSLAMLPRIPDEIQEALDHGITIVAGEIENRWRDLLRTAYENRLEPIYNYLTDRPSLEGMAGPIMPDIKRAINGQVSFDAGRGCPFKCSFCTIINVQGNVMRGRTADDIEKLVRKQHARGFSHFFITDDNFARHKHWEEIADRLIDLKENQGLRRLSLKIQTDTAAHKIPNFIEKMSRAGVRRVFIGLETVNPENLRDAGKYHNQLKEYRRMLQKWRDHGVLVFSGYIIGFPGDTYDSIMRDVEILKRELPLDHPEFFMMTPLPGSEDHQKLWEKNAGLEKDTNLYDTAHVCIDHPKMSRSELERAYEDAWKSFYSKEHIKTLLLRRKGPRRRLLRNSLVWFCSMMWLDKMHPLLGGFFRFKGRKSRRRGMPIEPFIPYYAKRVFESVWYVFGLLGIIAQMMWWAREASRPENADYQDVAITPEPSSPAAVPVSSDAS